MQKYVKSNQGGRHGYLRVFWTRMEAKSRGKAVQNLGNEAKEYRRRKT